MHSWKKGVQVRVVHHWKQTCPLQTRELCDVLWGQNISTNWNWRQSVWPSSYSYWFIDISMFWFAQTMPSWSAIKTIRVLKQLYPPCMKSSQVGSSLDSLRAIKLPGLYNSARYWWGVACAPRCVSWGVDGPHIAYCGSPSLPHYQLYTFPPCTTDFSCVAHNSATRLESPDHGPKMVCKTLVSNNAFACGQQDVLAYNWPHHLFY